MPVKRYFTSIKQACRENTTLRLTIAATGVTPRHLLKRMHEVDPRLRWRTVDFKREKTEKNKQARIQACVQMLRRLERMNARYDFHDLLKCIFWVDYWTMYLADENCKVKIYADAFDDGAAEVMHIEGLPPNTHIRLHVLACVNYYTGPFYWEPGTGTTDLQRDNIQRVGPYLVSCTGRKVGV
jgi:hypothetical protein